MNHKILFIFQEANFRPRTMIVPKNLFLKARQQDYDTLKHYASHENKTSVLYIYPNTPFGEDKDYIIICNFLCHLADGVDIKNLSESDREWYMKTKINVYNGGNVQEAYSLLTEKFPQYEVFLVLENKKYLNQ
jgi:hypothetical protein